MALGEPHKPVEHRLTADENGLRPRTAALPGSRLDMSAHPTDFKYSDSEARDNSGRWTMGGGKKPSDKPVTVVQGDAFKPGSRSIPKPSDKAPEKFNREAAIKDKSSAAYGGRLPIGNELKSIHHITNTRTAGLKSSYQIDPQFAQDSYGADSDGGNFVYVGLNKEAAELAAVSTGVRFILNGNPYKDRAVVQPDQEGGIAMFHGSIPRDSIYAVIVDEPDSKEGKAVMDAWDKLKKERASR